MPNLRKKRVLRTITNDATVDKALREIYDKLDALQPEIVLQSSPMYNKQAPVGQTMLVNNTLGEESLAIKTVSGWKVDINSKLVGVTNTNFNSSKSPKSIRGEALLYDSSSNLKTTGNLTVKKNLVVNNDLTVSGGDIYGPPTDTDLTIRSNKAIYFQIDNDDDESGLRYVFSHNNGSDSLFYIDDSGNTNCSGSSLIGTISEVGSDTDKILMSDSGTVKYVTGANLRSYIGAGTSSMAFSGSTANGVCTYGGANQIDVEAGFIYNAGTAACTILGQTTLDTNNLATTDSTTTSLVIDYDHTGISALGQSVEGIGLDLNMNCQSVTHVGTVLQTGIDIDIVGSADGTQTTTGMDIKCTGAARNHGLNITVPDDDNDYHIKLMAADDSTNDYATFELKDTGDLYIETVGNGTTDSDITLTADGTITLDAADDIILNADGGAIRLADGLAAFTPLHASDITNKSYVDGLNKFYVHDSNYSGRMGNVNYWYVSNQSFGVGVGAADFGYPEYKYAMFNAVSACTITGWSFHGYVTSTEPYELALYAVTPPSDGGIAASGASLIGSVQDLESGGGDVAANRMYSCGETGLSLAIAAGRQIYLVHRYTHGSGNKTIYGSLTLEFEVA